GHQGSAEHHRFGPAQHYQHLPFPTENHKFRALKSERKRLPRHETRSGSASRWAWEGWPRPKTDVPAMISRSARAAKLPRFRATAERDGPRPERTSRARRAAIATS